MQILDVHNSNHTWINIFVVVRYGTALRTLFYVYDLTQVQIA